MKDLFSTKEYFEKMDRYFRASNYLALGQLYLLDNPLLRDHELSSADIKRKLVGHWGTVPGQNFIYAHCNRVIKKYDLNMILLSGPGHGGNFLTANSYLEGVYSEVYPNISQDREGMKRFFKQFSFPGGIGSHCVPETPGSLHEGGELGYSLVHAYGAVLDNPDLIATSIVGDGEAETGPIATSWHLNKFLNPATDGAVLPILHLNGYKISNPTILSRIPESELMSLFVGYGYTPFIVKGKTEIEMHKNMAKAMDEAIEIIKKIQSTVRSGKVSNLKFPVIILRSAKGWTGPKEIDGKIVENSFRAHQIPITMTKPEHLKALKDWLLSYRPDELFDENYQLYDDIKSTIPVGDRRMTANKNANGGLKLKELKLPSLKKLAVKFSGHGTIKTQDMFELGGYIRDLMQKNKNNYRIFSPDEAMSNRLYKVFENENRTFNTQILDSDEHLAVNGRVMDSLLSEHACEGLLEGYLLTGRHGLFDSYEAFIRVVDSMFSQHAKWLKVAKTIPWRAPISSLNLICTSNVWQQDHNGYTHQDPGLLTHLAEKHPSVIRLYLPPDANTLMATFDKCTKSKDMINALVASKHPTYQWLNMDDALKHCESGIGEWAWASMNNSKNPDVVIASCGDTVTIESLATISLLKKYLPKLNVKFVNIIDLLKLQSNTENPHGLTDKDFDKIFTTDKPVIFNFHGYPNLIYSLVHNRHNQNFVVSGYMEEGTITTAFDMRVLNKVDRYNQVLKVLDNIKIDKSTKDKIAKEMKSKLKEHYNYIREYGVDMPEVANWNWND